MGNRYRLIQTMIKAIRLLPKTGFADTRIELSENRLIIATKAYLLHFGRIDGEVMLLNFIFENLSFPGPRPSHFQRHCWLEVDCVCNEVAFFTKEGTVTFRRKPERMAKWCADIRSLYVAAMHLL
ncbi:hypothetical protein [Cohnella sp. GbtcB17]|uniref:hypothetical protein n=1 Tax=Cohnella sp. GbtcB17 TaxID=2824762 RepID=UPI001C310D05|nr:hypothetical protein [Cohnella sp. GbtcB17]